MWRGSYGSFPKSGAPNMAHQKWHPSHKDPKSRPLAGICVDLLCSLRTKHIMVPSPQVPNLEPFGCLCTYLGGLVYAQLGAEKPTCSDSAQIGEEELQEDAKSLHAPAAQGEGHDRRFSCHHA